MYAIRSYYVTFNSKNFNIEELTSDGITYQYVNMGVSTMLNEKGWAELPFISASVELPADKDVDLNIVYTA